MSSLVSLGFRVFNRVERALSKQLPRTTSYPFLACDTYFAECDLSFSGAEPSFNSRLKEITNQKAREEMSVYCSLTKVPELLMYIEQNNGMLFAQLLVGDSDETLSEKLKKDALFYFKELYIVNHGRVGQRIFNLPIGLENKFYSSPLRLKVYMKENKQPKLHGLLVCWNDETNPQERLEARVKLKSAPITFHVEKRIPFQLLAKYMRNSYLVACPAGNGVDTHRIWESLYLGSLPVMLEKDASIFESVWPIYKVKSWDDLASMTLDEAVDVFEMFKDRITSINEISKDFLSKFRKEN